MPDDPCRGLGRRPWRAAGAAFSQVAWTGSIQGVPPPSPSASGGDPSPDEDAAPEGGDETATSGPGDPGAYARPPSVTARLSQLFVKPANPAKPASADNGDDGPVKMTEEEKARAIRQVDPTERKIGYFGAALIAVIGLVSFVAFIDNPKKTVPLTVPRSGKSCPSGYKAELIKGAHDCFANVHHPRSYWILELAIVLVFAAFVLVATRVGRRSMLAFALLFGGLAVESTTGSILGLGFVVAGGWLMVRAYRVQKYGSPTAKSGANAAERPTRADRERPAKAGAAAGGGSRSSKSAKSAKTTKATQTTADGRPKPGANKRYTPKAPPRKKPVAPPS